MAATIKSDEKVGRTDVFCVNPFDIEFKVQSRLLAEPTEEADVRQRAYELATIGQITPIVCTKDEDNQLHLVAGNYRLKAARLLREGFQFTEDDGEVRTYHDPNFKIKVEVKKLTPDEAFDLAVLENHARKNTTPLQEALIQEKYREERGWTDAKIANFFGYTNQNRVGRLKRLLDLPADVRDKVHAGDLSLDAAVRLTEASPDEREAILEAATDPTTGKVDGAEVKRQVREKAAGKAGDDGGPDRPSPAGGSGSPTKTTLKWTARDLKQWIVEAIEDNELHPLVLDLLDAQRALFDGEYKTAKKLAKAAADLSALLPKAAKPDAAGASEKGKKSKATKAA